MFKQAFKPVSRLAVLISAIAVAACSSVDDSNTRVELAKATVHNPSSFAREDEALFWSFHDIGLPLADPARPLVVVVDGNAVPSQVVDSDGDGEQDAVMSLLDFAPGATHDVTIQYSTSSVKPVKTDKRTQAEISIKEGGRWVARDDGSGFKNYEGGSFKNVDTVTPPDYYSDHSYWIRYEGPGIESDKVGYRVYLDWRNGFDIFGKSVAEPILQKVGQDGYDSYHEPQPWGLDILKVGSSLGAGGFGFWTGEEVVGLKDVSSRSATVVEDGDLFSGVRIDYNGWQVNGQTVDVESYLTMHAGSRMVHNQLTLSEDLPNLAVGIVNHEGTTYIEGESNIPSDNYTYVATWGQQSLAGDNLGLAVFVKKRDLDGFKFDGKSRIALIQTAQGQADYYFSAVWQGEHGDGVSTIEGFKEYLSKEVEKLNRGVREDFTNALTEKAAAKPLSKSQALYWSKALADSELQRKTLQYKHNGWDEHRKRLPKFEYDIVGLLPYAYDQLGDVTGDSRYENVKNQVTASYIQQDGSIARYKKSNYNIDSIAPGRVVLALYKDTGEQKYKKAADTLFDQLHNQPRTSNNAFWHKKRYPGQLWLDGVYMGMPFMAEYSVMFENGKSLDEVVNEFRVTRELLRDPETGLYYHAWDENKVQDWADPETGLSPHFWGRGTGWLAMALVDVLDYIPEERREDREFLIDMSVELAKTLAQYQDKATHTWWQIMNEPGREGNYRESSASAMFTYFFAKAINNGYLTDENFGGDVTAFTKSAYQGLVSEFGLVHLDGKVSMTNICHVAGLGFGRDGSYDYYMDEAVVRNDPKGTGPFILAGVEVSKLF